MLWHSTRVNWMSMGCFTCRHADLTITPSTHKLATHEDRMQVACSSRGSVSLAWRLPTNESVHHEASISRTLSKTSVSESRTAMDTTLTLVLASVKADHAGNYTCVKHNDVTQQVISSNKFQLYLKPEVRIEEMTSSSHLVSKTRHLRCQAKRSNLQQKLVWTWRNEVIRAQCRQHPGHQVDPSSSHLFPCVKTSQQKNTDESEMWIQNTHDMITVDVNNVVKCRLEPVLNLQDSVLARDVDLVALSQAQHQPSLDEDLHLVPTEASIQKTQGSDLAVECYGYPNRTGYTLTWLRLLNDNSNASALQGILISEDNHVIEPGKRHAALPLKSTLKFTNILTANSGRYSCILYPSQNHRVLGALASIPIELDAVKNLLRLKSINVVVKAQERKEAAQASGTRSGNSALSSLGSVQSWRSHMTFSIIVAILMRTLWIC